MHTSELSVSLRELLLLSDALGFLRDNVDTLAALAIEHDGDEIAQLRARVRIAIGAHLEQADV